MPRGRLRDFFEHLFRDCLAPGGRLILGPYTEEGEDRRTESDIRSWGYAPKGTCEKSHQDIGALHRRMLWFDRD
jgi:hypothetical protein